MPRPSNDLSRIPATDLVYAVSQLIAAGKTSAGEVHRLAGDRAARIAALQQQLQALHAGQAVDAAPRRGPGRPAGQRSARKAAAKPKRRFTMTPKARAARKIQGQYLGRLRKLRGADRAKVKAAARKESVGAAVKLADGMIG
jgi:hypothetical protein